MTENRDKEKRKQWLKEYYVKKTASGYWKSKAYKRFRKQYRQQHPISKTRKKYQKVWKANQRAQFKELIVELRAMMESGTITVGAFGLSENSAKYIFDLKNFN